MKWRTIRFMKSYIAAIGYSSKTGRLTLSIDLDPLDTLRALIVDGVRAPGAFEATAFGWLYKHTDGVFGLPGRGYGSHSVAVRKTRNKVTDQIVASVSVPNPPSSLGKERVWPAENLIPLLWGAGFRGEQGLLNPLSIAVGESGLYATARNWLPSTGFRPATAIIGVQGPAAAWNNSHTQQGHSDRGLFQVNSRWWPQFSDAQCDVPAEACRTIFSMSNGGTDFTAWGFGAGETHYEQFWDQSSHGFPALRPLVQKFLTTPSR